MAYDQFGKDTEMIVQDSSSFAAEGERISFLQVQVPSSSLLCLSTVPPLRALLLSWSKHWLDCLPAETSAGRVASGASRSSACTLAGHCIAKFCKPTMHFVSWAHAAVYAQARAMAVKQVLVGFYDIPKSVEQPLQLVINPEVYILKLMFDCLKHHSCSVAIQQSQQHAWPEC